MCCETITIIIKKAFLDYDFFLTINYTTSFDNMKRIYIHCSNDKDNFYFTDSISYHYLNNSKLKNKDIILYKTQEGIFSLLSQINSNLDELKKILLTRKYGTNFLFCDI